MNEPIKCRRCFEEIMPIGSTVRCPVCGHNHGAKVGTLTFRISMAELEAAREELQRELGLR